MTIDPTRQSIDPPTPPLRGRPMLMITVVLLGLVTLICIYFTILSFLATRPENLGIGADGRLAPCPIKPNCVSSYAPDPEHNIPPYTFTDQPAAAWQRLKEIVKADPFATVIIEDDKYLYAEFRSLIFRFVDDVEWQLDPASHQIQIRSASRAGYSDLGVNRSRLESIRRKFAEASP
jgi:uncharacterized protein (DUF1499 family)